MSSAFAQYSAHDADFVLEQCGATSAIRKTVRFRTALQSSVEHIYSLSLEYVGALQRAGIPVPQVMTSEWNATQMQFVCAYKGVNVVEAYGGDMTAFVNSGSLFEQAIGIVHAAVVARFPFDPHLKNFVIDDGHVYYVDFCPPWGEPYFSLRLAIASPHEREILRTYFSCFAPERVLSHFGSDIVKVDARSVEVLPQVYDALRARGLMSDDFEQFLAVGKMIRQVEHVREHEQIYLL